MKYSTLTKLVRDTSGLRRAAELLSAKRRAQIIDSLRRLDKIKTVNRALTDAEYNLGLLEQFVLGRPTAVTAPVALISQVHRSGGTLLSQLFDGHPAIAAHPNELKISNRAGEQWPDLNSQAGMAENFRQLFEANIIGALRRGYAKGERDPDRHAFLMLPRLQYRLFASLWDRSPPVRRRDILDHYFTAYFNSWLNYQGEMSWKSWIIAFAPRLANDEAAVAAFFADYPDGRLIQILRDPSTWYPSAKHHGRDSELLRDLNSILDQWCVSANAILRNRALYGDRVVILRFEDLVGQTEVTMRRLCREIAVDFDPILLRPTFNGRPIVANSSFEVGQRGVMIAPLAREKMLSEQERERIEQLCRPLYEEIAAQILAAAA
jgi:Sulfotransferase family